MKPLVHPALPFIPLLLPLLLTGLASAEDTPLPVAALSRDTPVDFNAELVPFLRKNCFACHNQTKAKADLILETPAAILEGGESGPAVEPGNGQASLLFISAAHLDDPPMPPARNKSNAVDLDPEQLALLKLWIDQGAKGTAQTAPPAPKIWRRSDHEPIYTLALSIDGRFAACGRGHHVHVYDLIQQSLVAELVDPDLDGAAHRDFVHSIAFGPDRTLATGGYREVKIWRLPEVTAIAEEPPVGDHTAIATSPDGKWRALGRADGSIDLLDRANPSAAPVTVKDHEGAVNALAFLPDSLTLLSGSADKSLRRRSLADPARSDSLLTPAEVVSLTSIENGTRLSFGTQDNKIQLVAVSSFDPAPESAPEAPRSEFIELTGSNAPATILRTVRIGEVEHLLSAGADATVRIWNIANKNQVRSISVGAAVVALAVSADGSKVVVQRAGSGPARVFKLADGTVIGDLELDPTLSRQMAALQLDQQMNTRVAAFYKSEVPKVEDLLKKEREAGEKAEKDLPTAKEAVTAKQAEFDNKTAAKQHADEALTQLPKDDPKIAEAQRAVDKARTELEKAEEELTTAKRDVAALESNREQTAKQAEELARKVEDTKAKQTSFEEKVEALTAERDTLQKQLSEEVPKLEIAGVAFSPDGARIATALPDGTVRFYNAADGAYLESIATGPGVSSLSMTADDQLITHHDDGRSVTWSTHHQWSLASKIGDGQDPALFPGRVTALAFSPDGTVLASGSGVPSRSGELRFWNPMSLEEVGENVDAHSDTISDIDFSPAGDHVVTGSPDKFVKTFEVATGNVVRSYEAHTSNVLGIAWSHDGRLLASASADQEVKIWDEQTGEQVRTLKGWEQEVTSVAFYSKSNEQVLTSCGDKRLRLDNNAFATTDDFQYAAAVSSDGKFIVAGGEDGVLRVWNASRQLVKAFPSPHAEPAEGMAATAGR